MSLSACVTLPHKSIGIDRFKTAIMPYIEIWKSKPSWDNAPLEKRIETIRALTELVKANAERTDGNIGPFLPCTDTGCALVWEVRVERAEALKGTYQRILGDLFEPLMFGSQGGLTAKDYADRLLGKKK